LRRHREVDGDEIVDPIETVEKILWFAHREGCMIVVLDMC
jgi:hypothetical protein